MKKLQQRSVAELIDQYLEVGLSLDEMADLFKNSILVHVLDLQHGNVTKAAEVLKIHRNTAQRFMTKFHLHKETFKDGTDHMESTELASGNDSQLADEDNLESAQSLDPDFSTRRRGAGPAGKTSETPKRA